MHVRVEINFFKTEIEIMFSSTDNALTVSQSDNCLFFDRRFSSVIQTLRKKRVGKEVIASLIRSLDVSHTSIKKFPTNITNFVNLKSLFARGTQVEELPKFVFLISSLSHLYLSHNEELATIAPEIGKAKELQHLDISFSPIRQLPSEIGGAKKLESLDISFTEIKVLPGELAELPLKKIWLYKRKQDRVNSFSRFSYFILACLVEKGCVIYADWEIKERILEMKKYREKLPDAKNYWHCFIALSKLARSVDSAQSSVIVIAQACAILPLADLISSYCGRPFAGVKEHTRFFKRIRNYQPPKSTPHNVLSLGVELRRDYDFLEKTICFSL